MNPTHTPSNLSRLAVAAALTALLAACGGGGGDTSNTSTPVSTPAPSLTEIPLQSSAPNAYPVGSDEYRAFERINKARTECGFGALAQDPRLDRMAEGHAKYVLSKDALTTHDQLDPTSPLFTGKTPEDRAIATGYLNAQQSNGFVSEGLNGGQLSTLRGGGDKSYLAYGLLNAPYHALDLLAPRQNVGISLQTPAKSGLPDRRPDLPVEDTVLVVNTGTPASNARAIVQQLPAGELLSWPCNATSTRLYVGASSEVPDPFAGKRDLQAQPAGSPFYVMARYGSKLRVTSAKLTNLTTGRVVPLLPARHSDTEIFPGTDRLFSHANLMDWAFIFPDERLEAGAPGIGDSRMRMEITAVVSGKTISKTVEYTVSLGGPDR